MSPQMADARISARPPQSRGSACSIVLLARIKRVCMSLPTDNVFTLVSPATDCLQKFAA